MEITEEPIIANDDNICQIVEREIKRLGNDADLNHIDVSRVTNMVDLFSSPQTSNFNGDISKWDVSNVTDMYCMFKNSKFNGDLSNWNVKNITFMNDVFDQCPLEKNPPKWYRD